MSRDLHRHEDHGRARQEQALPRVSTLVFAICAVVWFVALNQGAPAVVDTRLGKWMGFRAEGFDPRSFLTHHFLHEDWLHLLLNCACIFCAGGAIERRWGPARFAAFYLSAALISGLAVYVTDVCWRGFAQGDAARPPALTLGASGAALACLTAFSLAVEDRPALFFVTRRHLIWTGMLLGAAGLLLLQETHTARNPGAPLSLLPQVAGIAAGAGLWLSLPGWERYSRRRARLRAARLDERALNIRLRVDRLLEKISRHGWESLSREERSFLQDASKHFRNPR